MSEAPDLGIILDVLSNFEGLSPDAFLAKALPSIPTQIPDVRFARFYRLYDGKAVLEAATDSERPTGSYMRLDTTRPYAEAAQNLTGALDNGVWVIALRVGEAPYGLLEIGVPLDATPTAAFQQALQLIAQYFTQAFFTAMSRDLMRRQAQAASDLTRCSTFTEMAGAIGRNMLRSGQFISIDLMDYDLAGVFTGLRVIASANRHQTFDTAEKLTITLEEFGQTLNQVTQNSIPVLVNDVTNDTLLSPHFRKWLAGHKIEAICCFPMRRGAQVFGVIALNSIEGPLYLTEDEILAYQNLVDQISALVQAHHLAEESARSQDISERQALAFAELRSSQSFEEMAGIIARHMLPTPGRFLTISGLHYDAAGQMSDFRMLASANRERKYSLDMDLPFRWEGTSPRVRQLLVEGAPQIGETRLESAETVGSEVYAWLEATGVKHYMNLPMLVEGRPIAMLSVMSKSAPFSREEINAFSNLADQMGALIYTRDLLRQTEDTLVQVQMLYEVNRSILAAQDTLDVLRALRNFLAPDSLISHMLIRYNAENRFDGLTVTHLITPDGEQIVDLPLHERIGADKLIALQAYWQHLGTRLSVIENINQTDHPLQEFIQSQGTQSYIAIPIHDRGQLKRMVGISFDQPRTFDSLTRRLYESLRDQIGIVLQNQRLLQESQISAAELGKQVEVLQNINQLAISLSAIQDEKTLFERSSEMLYATLKIDHCGIVLADPGGATGNVVGEYPLQGALGSKIDLSNSPLFSQVWDHLQPLIVDDIDSQLEEATRQVLQTLGVKSLLIVPLVLQNQLVGTIGLDLYSPDRHFTPDMVEVARTMAAQIGVAIQNIRLLTDAQRHAQQLQRIAAFNQSVQATLDMAAIFNIALSESAQMLPMDEMKILLYDPGASHLRTVALHEDSKVQITLADGAIVPLDGSIEGRVWRSRELVYLPNESRSRDPRQPFKMDIGSDMLAPLQSRGRILGVVSVSCNRPHAYGETDFAVFRQMTDQLAVAIENAEAYTQSQRQARNEALVNEISTRLQRQTDIQAMLDITMNELGKALGARRARIRLATQSGDNDKSA